MQERRHNTNYDASIEGVTLKLGLPDSPDRQVTRVYEEHYVLRVLLRARYLASQTERDHWAAAMREHELIIDALSRRAAEELGELLREHLWHQYEASGKISIGFRCVREEISPEPVNLHGMHAILTGVFIA
jgi:hypothetical protein